MAMVPKGLKMSGKIRKIPHQTDLKTSLLQVCSCTQKGKGKR